MSFDSMFTTYGLQRFEIKSAHPNSELQSLNDSCLGDACCTYVRVWMCESCPNDTTGLVSKECHWHPQVPFYVKDR